MKCEILSKRLDKLVDKYSVDTGFSCHMQPIASYFESLKDRLEKLNYYAFKNNSTVSDKNSLLAEELLTVLQTEKEITKILNEMLADKTVEKFVKKYRSEINKVLQTKDELFEMIKENNAIEGHLEVAIAEKFLEDMKKIEKKEANDYDYLEQTANSGRKSYLTEHIESDDYRLISALGKAEKINKSIAEIPATEECRQDLEYLQNKSKKLYDSFSSTVIQHYDTLIKIDAEKNKDNPLIRDAVTSKLSYYEPEIEAE